MTRKQALLAVAYVAQIDAEHAEDMDEVERLRRLSRRIYIDAKGTPDAWQRMKQWMERKAP